MWHNSVCRIIDWALEETYVARKFSHAIITNFRHFTGYTSERKTIIVCGQGPSLICLILCDFEVFKLPFWWLWLCVLYVPFVLLCVCVCMHSCKSYIHCSIFLLSVYTFWTLLTGSVWHMPLTDLTGYLTSRDIISINIHLF